MELNGWPCFLLPPGDLFVCRSNAQDEPLFFAGATTFLVQTYASRWLLLEFSTAAHGSIPFPTVAIGRDARILVLKLPSMFDFDYCFGYRVCSWETQLKDAGEFFLGFADLKDYLEVQTVMSGRTRLASNRVPTHQCRLMIKAQQAFKEVVGQLNVDHLPTIEEVLETSGNQEFV